MEDRVLITAGQIGKCIKRPAVPVIGNVKCLLNHQGINLSIAVIVLKRTEEVPIQEDLLKEVLISLVLKTEADRLKITNNIIRSMQSLIKF